MDRRKFIGLMSVLPLTGAAMKLNAIRSFTHTLTPTPRMPVLFLGHGSPMNAIEENEFVKGFRNISKEIPKPQAILCISAHWETKGTRVTAMEMPKTIHDFGGFPPELFAVQYPAPGSPALAEEVKKTITKTSIESDHHWGLDHGAWSVIKHLYPDADVPVIQMSLDYQKDPLYHYQLGAELSSLREKGVLIVGSGNMVHNLRMLARDKLNAETYGFDWAIEANEKMKQAILAGDHSILTGFKNQGRSFDLAIPTPEHFLPLLYTLGLDSKKNQARIFNDKPVAGSLTMTSVLID